MTSPVYFDDKSAEFQNAAMSGNVEVLAELSKDSEVNFNWKDYDGWTALHQACNAGQAEAVKFLLSLKELHLDPINNDGETPFLLACKSGHAEVVDVILNDSRINVNRSDSSNQTPLWWASDKGHVQVVERMLASWRNISTRIKSIHTHTTAAEQADIRGRGHPFISIMLNAYEKQPLETRNTLRKALGVYEYAIGKIFALVIYVADGYLRVKDNESDASRFFVIASMLPIELQMLLCCRTYGSMRSIVLIKYSEPAFRKYAKE